MLQIKKFNMEDRQYQINASSNMVKFLTDTRRKGGEICIAPTGAGKSYIIAMIVKELSDCHVLVVQPSTVLLEQNMSKMIELGIKPSVYSGSLNSKEIGRVTYATIRSLKDADKFKKLKNLVVLQDECHLETLGDRNGNSPFKEFLKKADVKRYGGFTATPLYLISSIGGSELKMMTDRRGSLYKRINYCIQVNQMISNGYWSEVIYDIQNIDDTPLRSNSNGSDFSQLTVNEFYKTNDLFNKIKGCLEYHCNRKSVLIFVPSISDAKALQKIIEGSEVVHSEISVSDRNKLIDDFKSLKIRVMINVNVLSVGFDHPKLDHIIDGYPTMSFNRWYQKWGRGVRRDKTKENCLISDFSGSYDKFGRLEDINFDAIPEYGFALFTGNVLVSGIPLTLKIRPTKEELKDNRQRVRNIKREASESPKMPFGKYKGKTVSEIYKEDKGYLAWMISDKTSFDFKSISMQSIKTHIERILTI